MVAVYAVICTIVTTFLLHLSLLKWNLNNTLVQMIIATSTNVVKVEINVVRFSINGSAPSIFMYF
jgi:hypothetical protein